MTESEEEHGPAAGMVVFGGDAAVVDDLIRTLTPQISHITVIVNGWARDAVRAVLAHHPEVTVIESVRNRGIGTALNSLMARSPTAGTSYLLLLDQDSRPTDDLVTKLLAAADALTSAGEKAAAVGPSLIAPAASHHKGPRYFFRDRRDTIRGAVPVHYLPTSGTLISIDAFREIGPFRDDYFIDGIDLEWCFRAWSKGYSCWLATDITMEHTVGEGSVGALGFRTPHQNDFRLETYVRNTVYGFRLPHIPLSWKLRQAAYLVAQVALLSVANRFRPSLLKRLSRGFVNGLRGRLGPPEGVPFT